MCSHDPIFRTDKESSIWRQNDHMDIMQNLSAPFIFQEECRMKIECIFYFHPFFSKLPTHVSEDHFHSVHTIRFSEPTKSGSLKTDRVKGLYSACFDCINLASFGYKRLQNFGQKNVQKLVPEKLLYFPLMRICYAANWRAVPSKRRRLSQNFMEENQSKIEHFIFNFFLNKNISLTYNLCIWRMQS